MTLAIFDLDNTLLGGDSDHLWGCFACERGLVDSDDFGERNKRFYEDYQQGILDIDAYLRFALSPLVGRSQAELRELHRDFMDSKIRSIMLPKAKQLIESHRVQGHDLMIITATNSFITRPIAQALGIEQLLASEGEIVDGQYTGQPQGIPAYHAGKVTRLERWMDQHGASLDGSWFYSDSHNDLPLLERVDNPVAVDPDDTLLARARENGWPVISLR